VAEELTAAEGERQAAIAAATDAARRHSAAIAADAEARGALARLERDQAERDRIAVAVAASEARLALLRRLVAAFGVTGIPARIIEGVLPELTRYAQELLDQLRPGMELSIRAQRAKRDGKGIVEALDLVVQDAAGERPLALFSGGERMSVSLALAVGLSRLVARRAGTAIRTLVVDEPDGLDAEARRAFGSALRVLAHHGELERVVLVTHHEDLAEVGDSVYRVSKGPGGSVVEQIS
jgi:DNA repair exonuclease SbcCD ATPase subunit